MKMTRRSKQSDIDYIPDTDEAMQYIWVSCDLDDEHYKGLKCCACGKPFTAPWRGAYVLMDMFNPDELFDTVLHTECFGQAAKNTQNTLPIYVAYPNNVINRSYGFPRIWELVLKARNVIDALDEGTLGDMQQSMKQALRMECEGDPEALEAAEALADEIFDSAREALEELSQDAEELFVDVLTYLDTNKVIRNTPENNHYTDRRSAGSSKFDTAWDRTPGRGRIVQLKHEDGIVKCDECAKELCTRKFCKDHDHVLRHIAETGHVVNAAQQHDLKDEAVVCTSL